MTQSIKTKRIGLLTTLFILLISTSVFAERPVTLGDRCTVIRSVNTYWIDDPMTSETPSKAVYTIKTGPEGELIGKCQRAVFKLRPDSQVSISGKKGDIKRISLDSGGLLVLLNKDEHHNEVRINVDEGIVELEKGGLYLERLESKTYVSVHHGLVRLMLPEKQAYEHVLAKERPKALYMYTSNESERTFRKAKLKYYSSQEFIALYDQLGITPEIGNFAGATNRPKRKFF